MPKFAIAVLVAVLVCQGYSNPLVQDGDIAKAAAAGDWDGVQKILKQHTQNGQIFSPQAQTLPKFGFSDTRNGGSEGRFFSQSEYSYQQKKIDRDGVVSEDKGGLGMVNDNGRISYYKPQHNTNTGVSAPYGK